MRFVTFEEVVSRLREKSIAIVGSAPSCLDNKQGFIDSHEIVVRVNNFKLGAQQGRRTDVHYAFYGSSIRSEAKDLKACGVTLCMCKCPDAKALDSEWHERTNRPHGVDYRYIYRARKDWWFCDTFIPDIVMYRAKFALLNNHIPTTGFAAVLDVLACSPRSVYLTGFDFFTSGRHNVNEVWKPGPADDPICHRPDLEAQWIFNNAHLYPLTFDQKLLQIRLQMSRETRAAGAKG